MKTTIQILYDRRLFDTDNQGNSNEALKDFLLTEDKNRRRLDLEKVNDVVQWINSKIKFQKQNNIKYKKITNPFIFLSGKYRDLLKRWSIWVSYSNCKNWFSKGTHLVAYNNENYCDSYGCGPPKNQLGLLWNEMDLVYIVNTKYKVWQVKEFLIVQVFVNIKTTWQVSGIVFESAVLNLYHQTFSWMKMTLLKLTIDNSTKYMAQSEKTFLIQERNILNETR